MIRYHNGTYIAEFLIPRDDDSNGNDAQLQHQIPFNIVLLDRLVLDANDNSLIAGHLASLAPSIETPALWPQLPIHAHNTTHLQQPTDLGGLIAYISKTNNSLGDIFLFDPDTRVKTKITPTSAADLALFNSLKKDAISLSNDHSRVAFHAYPGTGTILDAEIYVLNHITGALTQLTNNGHIDGHPAWSPDDTTIAFASYNPAHGDGGSHIYTIASNGSGTVSDITALHNPYVGNVLYRVEENDPEYLRDGRLLIKTNRWTPWQRDGGGPYQHELAIASINSDGSQLTQLSFPNGTIDHDPIANGQYIVWERLMVDIDYSATVQSFYEPWHLLRTPIAGGPVSTILADDWVNWLPVPQPDGNYIAYFKQSGYNECRLLDPSGNDIGRFIPDETQLGYMDWKADPIPAAATQ